MAYTLNYITHTNNTARQASLLAGDASTDQSDSNYPVSNMLQLPVSKKGRIRNIYGPMELQVSFPGATDVDTVALVGHNLSNSAKVTVYGGASFDPTTSLGTITWRNGTMFKKFSSTQSYKYYKISIDDPANDYGYASIGYLVMGKASTLSFGYSSYRFTNRKLGIMRETEFGSPAYQSLSGGDDLLLSFRNRTQSEADSIVNIFNDLSGSNEPALWIPNPVEDDCVFGRFSEEDLTREFVLAYPPLVNIELIIRGDNFGRDVVEELPRIVAGEALPSGWTFTRTSIAYYKNRNLELVQASAGECRTSHYLLPGKPTVLLEPASTNKILYSEQFDNASWSKSGVTISPNTYNEPKVSPASTADSITQDTSTGQHYVQQNITITANANFSISIFVKPITSSFNFRLRALGSTNIFTVNCSVSNYIPSIYSITKSGTGNYNFAYIEPFVNGWYRVVVSGSVGSSITSIAVELFGFLDNYFSANFQGDGTTSCAIWGAQVEELPFATSYIYTAGTETTRTADLLTYDLPSGFPAQPLTGYIKFVEMGGQYTTSDLFRIIGTSVPPRFRVYNVSNSGFAFEIRDSNNYGFSKGYFFANYELVAFDNVEFSASLGNRKNMIFEAAKNGSKLAAKTNTNSNFIYNSYTKIGVPTNSTNPYFMPLESFVLVRGVKDIDYMRKRIRS